VQDQQEQSKEHIILNAAVACINRWGVDRFSMADIAKEADVARSTVYMYFKNRDEVIRAALLQSAYAFGEKLLNHMARFTKPEDRMVETVVFCVSTLPEEPFLAMVSSSVLSDMVREYTLTTEAGMDIGTAIMKEILQNPSINKAELREISEYAVRFVLSLITMESPLINNDADLRGYIARRLLPSVGLKVPASFAYKNDEALS